MDRRPRNDRPRSPLVAASYAYAMTDHFDVIDCEAGRGWSLIDETTAVRYAAAQHAATGHVIEVVRVHSDVIDQLLVLPPSAPVAFVARMND